MTFSQNNSPLEAALEYHRLIGWNVIPVIVTHKSPPKGLKWRQYCEEKMTEEQIRSLFDQYPDAGVAAIMGSVSKTIALDIDKKHGRSLSEFRIPPTAVSRTQNDGRHVFFKHPGFYVKGTKGMLFGPGVDVQGDKNLVVLPPTPGINGSYSWEEEPTSHSNLADAPDWLIEALHKQAVSTSGLPLTNILKGVSEGSRNDAACTFIGTLLSGSDPSEWEEAWSMIKVWNATCVPPEAENILRNKFDSIATKELAKRQSSPMDHLGINAKQSNTSTTVLTPPMSLKELSEKDLPPTDWDIEQLIEHGTPNMLSAAPNNFKTWLVDERYPFLKTTILSIINQLIQRIWQRKVIASQKKSKTRYWLRLKMTG